jgi:hypothetical protein
MPASRQPSLSIEYLDDQPDGLRRVSQANWTVECLIVSRQGLIRALADAPQREQLDQPGVYLLTGPSDSAAHKGSCYEQLYVGQSDSIADRLDTHLKTDGKKWWQTLAAIRLSSKAPLNLSQCKFLESKLCEMAAKAGRCAQANKNAPKAAVLSANYLASTEEVLGKALFILNALGFTFFQPKEQAPEAHQSQRLALEPPPIPAILQPLLNEVRSLITGPEYSSAVWYWTKVPDYRAKVVNKSDFRVFLRVLWTKKWLWVGLKENGRYKISSQADISGLRDRVKHAYEKAERYLQSGT